MSKLVINLDSTALGNSSCMLNLYRTVIGSLDESGQSAGGYRERLHGPELVYGIGVHKFIDVAYKTSGDLVMARKRAVEMFENIETRDHPKKPYLRDKGHLTTVCFNLWNDYVLEDNNFELLELVLPCWMCRGKGDISTGKPAAIAGEEFFQQCPHCKGAKNIPQAGTEVTFSIKYYEDDYVIINLCGTIDKIGKFRNGPYAIGDWKTSGTWDNRGYFQQYELSRQLRMYNLAIKLMGVLQPDSVLGKLGQTQLASFIDAVFINKDPNATKFERSEIYSIKPRDLDEFQLMLDDKIKQISLAVKTGYVPKEGILNGTCIKYQNVSEQNFVKCQFWNVCRTEDKVSDLLLRRDFKRVAFNPLSYNEV